jgi:hypothetical protein
VRREGGEGRGRGVLMDGGEGADSPCHGGGRPTSPGGMKHWLEVDVLPSMPILLCMTQRGEWVVKK